MITKMMKNLDSKTRQKIVQGSVIPRPIAWLTTLNTDNSINLAPFSYFTMLSSTMVGVSIQRVAGKQKDTARNLLRTKEAVIQIPDRSLLKLMDLSAKPLDENHSEIDLTGLTTVASDLVKVPGLQDAKIRMEAFLETSIPLEDYNKQEIEADLFLLRIEAAHLADTVYDQDKNYVLHENLEPLARLAGPNYATINTITDFQRQF
ncbi:MAG: flavin reductase family protein [Clostridiaceae bacterium]|jgi:flavin reductase (DIM6/NTAB) family NADH-FMN oxidoreductase RutF|nr:flavin reductase family protein [Bacillota bacterium]NLN52440.1 flavin reductase family protein [Clostridiaceae bacterium]